MSSNRTQLLGILGGLAFAAGVVMVVASLLPEAPSPKWREPGSPSPPATDTVAPPGPVASNSPPVPTATGAATSAGSTVSLGRELEDAPNAASSQATLDGEVGFAQDEEEFPPRRRGSRLRRALEAGRADTTEPPGDEPAEVVDLGVDPVQVPGGPLLLLPRGPILPPPEIPPDRLVVLQENLQRDLPDPEDWASFAGTEQNLELPSQAEVDAMRRAADQGPPPEVMEFLNQQAAEAYPSPETLEQLYRNLEVMNELGL
ncbi:hypothetical protein MK489_24030 [Myxococcota bacterium]|nr:hypothetical protein [Myxococcota bacterium]